MGLGYSGFVVLCPLAGEIWLSCVFQDNSTRGNILCLVLASAAALTSHPRCGFYTRALLLPNVPGHAVPNKRCTVPKTCCPCNFSHADTSMRNTFTPPRFLTRMFQGAVMRWVRMLLRQVQEALSALFF